MILSTLPVFDIDLPQPPIGNKIYYASQAGFYILEKGPCVWQAMANTHQGTGCIKVFNGVPNAKGHFENPPDEIVLIKNGRLVFNANPPILGMWMFAAGMDRGLTLEISGVLNNISPSITITWMPKVLQQRNIQAV